MLIVSLVINWRSKRVLNFSKLSEASLRINESLDFDTVLQEILDSARSLTPFFKSGVAALG